MKEIVYEKKEMSLPELGKVMAANWKGNEPLRLRMLRSKRKWGNNDPEANALGSEIVDAFASQLNGKPNSRGGIITTALHASNRFFQWADLCEATADGRRRGDELSKNMSATQGNAISGATSLVSSVLKFDSSLFMADLPVDIMLHPSEVKGDAGLSLLRRAAMTLYAPITWI